MNLINRIRKLERINPKHTQADKAECEHPPSMFKFYRDYPAFGYADQRLVTKGHCSVCGFDDYLWSHCALSEDQEIKGAN